MEKYNELPNWINSNYEKYNKKIKLYSYSSPIYMEGRMNELLRHYAIQDSDLSEEVAKKIYDNSKKFYSYDSIIQDSELEKKALKIIFFVLFLIIGYMLSVHNFQLLRLICNLID